MRKFTRPQNSLCHLSPQTEQKRICVYVKGVSAANLSCDEFNTYKIKIIFGTRIIIWSDVPYTLDIAVTTCHGVIYFIKVNTHTHTQNVFCSHIISENMYRNTPRNVWKLQRAADVPCGMWQASTQLASKCCCMAQRQWTTEWRSRWKADNGCVLNEGKLVRS